MGFMRYPGGKAKLLPFIISRLNECLPKEGIEYREPFFGAGSVGTELLFHTRRIKKLWINDKDPGIASLWTAIIRCPKMVQDRVRDFKPSVKAFDDFRDHLTSLTQVPSNDKDLAEVAFRKIAIHQISYSGLGTKSGGPLGGRGQKSKYKIDCRWSPDHICKGIQAMFSGISRFEIEGQVCTNLDFGEVIEPGSGALVYLDPPYYVKGNDLYQFGFKKDDHERLSKILEASNHTWLLSYDDCPEIRELYKWAAFETMGVNYSITATKKTQLVQYAAYDKEEETRESRQKDELLIYTQETKKLTRFAIQSTLF